MHGCAHAFGERRQGDDGMSHLLGGFMRLCWWHERSLANQPMTRRLESDLKGERAAIGTVRRRRVPARGGRLAVCREYRLTIDSPVTTDQQVSMRCKSRSPTSCASR